MVRKEREGRERRNVGERTARRRRKGGRREGGRLKGVWEEEEEEVKKEKKGRVKYYGGGGEYNTPSSHPHTLHLNPQSTSPKVHPPSTLHPPPTTHPEPQTRLGWRRVVCASGVLSYRAPAVALFVLGSW